MIAANHEPFLDNPFCKSSKLFAPAVAPVKASADLLLSDYSVFASLLPFAESLLLPHAASKKIEAADKVTIEANLVVFI